MLFSRLGWSYGRGEKREENYMCKVPFLSHLTKGVCHQHGLSQLTLNLIIWPRQCLSGFSTINLMISYCTLWQEAAMYNQYLRVRSYTELYSIFWDHEVTYIDYLNSSTGRVYILNSVNRVIKSCHSTRFD